MIPSTPQTRQSRPDAAGPLAQLSPASWDLRATLHLVNRAGFGGTPQQIRTMHDLGLQACVDYLVDYETVPPLPETAAGFRSDIRRPPTEEERAEQRRARVENDEAAIGRLQAARNQSDREDREQNDEMRKWWLKRMIETPRPLEEKMTLFWHGHFASGNRTVQDSYHMLVQNQLLRRHATGSFAELAYRIIRDPAMLKYLDADDNRKRSPNENLARELMELFVLGEGRGYSEADIKEGARALTGFTFRDDSFEFRDSDHDDGEKSILGRSGSHHGDDFVRILLSQRACSEFVCGKLYRFFVDDSPVPASPAAPAVIAAMAAQLRAQQYQLKPVLRSLFQSAHFYDPRVRGSVIKSPVQLVAQAVRGLQAHPRSLATLASGLEFMGQDLFQPPSVKGWDGGRAWINTSTMFIRQNVMVLLITGRQADFDESSNAEQTWDPSHLVTDASGAQLPPKQAIDALLEFCLSVPPHADRRAELAAFLNDYGDRIDRGSLLRMLGLISAMPEYQLC